MDNNKFGYFHGLEADRYAFCRIPKALIKDEMFKGLSTDAKLLYGLMLDRMSLSVKNRWLDEENRVYIIYTIENIAEDLGCGQDKAVKVLNELDDNKGIGLCQKVRKGLGKPNIIYVKNFADIYNREYKEFEEYAEYGESEVQNTENHNSRIMEDSRQESVESESNNINFNNTNIINTNFNKTEYQCMNQASSSINLPVQQNEMDDEDEYTYMINRIRKSVNMDAVLSGPYKEVKDYYSMLFDVIKETLLSKRTVYKLGSEEYSINYIKSQFMRLDSSHFDYIIECLEDCRPKIKNIRLYLLKSLINAPDTIDYYYTLQAKYDMSVGL